MLHVVDQNMMRSSALGNLVRQPDQGFVILDVALEEMVKGES